MAIEIGNKVACFNGYQIKEYTVTDIINGYVQIRDDKTHFHKWVTPKEVIILKQPLESLTN